MGKPCTNCNDTGMVYELREGTKYPHTCKECERYDAFELGSDIFDMARDTSGVPVYSHD